MDVITDGELRRSSFTGPLTDELEGTSLAAQPAIRWHGQPSQPTSLTEMVTGKIRRQRSLTSEEFSYARGKAGKPLKVTLPSPLMLSFNWSSEGSTAAYDDPFDLFADAVDILRQEVRDLVSLGCEYIQIDAPELATLVDESQRREAYEARGISPERMLGEGIDMLNAVADAPDITFGLHMCRGNYHGRWMSEGGYDYISSRVFPRATSYDIFLLEYDDWRSGAFEPLKDVPQDKRIVLGLVSTKMPAMEPPEELVIRIEEAGNFFPRDQLALSTQCGFASGFQGNPITGTEQEAKLRLVADVAHRVWS